MLGSRGPWLSGIPCRPLRVWPEPLKVVQSVNEVLPLIVIVATRAEQRDVIPLRLGILRQRMPRLIDGEKGPFRSTETVNQADKSVRPPVDSDRKRRRESKPHILGGLLPRF